ncbi:MAG: methyl-accepting chemotaxis protein [Bacillota bacterium]
MSIRNKLVAGFGIVLVVMGAIMGYLLYNINMVNRHYADLLANRIWLKDQALVLSKDFTSSAYDLRGYLLTGDIKARNSYRQYVSEAHSRITEMNSKVEIPEARALLEDIEGKMAGYETYASDLIMLKEAGQIEDIIKYSLENMQLLNGINSAIDEFVKFEEKTTGEHIVSSSQKVKQAAIISTAIALLAVLAGLLIAYFLSRSISQPLAFIGNKAVMIAGGDLTGDDIEVNRADELGQLARSFNQMKNSLAEFAGKVTEVAGKLADQSSRLAAQAQQTSAGASQTAAATGEIATSMEQVAENTQEVAQSASGMASHAGTGREGLTKISEEMASIALSTSEVRESINDLADDINSINQFVDIITSIAEQTNLLALNAAIEAARAGEFGRGFSVVAEEVRKLAEETSQSAKEIQQLTARVLSRSNQAVKVIATGSDRVVQGTQVVEKVSASLVGIINLSEGLTGQMQSVAAAAQQVSSGVQNMAATAEEQTAAMEEVTAAADNLNSLAMELDNFARRFKVT